MSVAQTREGKRFAVFADDVDRDRFLDLSIGEFYVACEHEVPAEVRNVFRKGGAYWMVGEVEYANGDRLLRRVYA